MAEKPKTREIEFMEDVKLGGQLYPAGCRSTFGYEEASDYIWHGWARDPRTGEQGERFTGRVVIRPHDLLQGQSTTQPVRADYNGEKSAGGGSGEEPGHLPENMTLHDAAAWLSKLLGKSCSADYILELARSRKMKITPMTEEYSGACRDRKVMGGLSGAKLSEGTNFYCIQRADLLSLAGLLDGSRGERGDKELVKERRLGSLTGGEASGVRRDLITVRIEDAQKDLDRQEKDPFDNGQVWLILADWAKQKVTPFIGATEHGLQWLDDESELRYLSRRSLAARLRRKRERLDKAR